VAQLKLPSFVKGFSPKKKLNKEFTTEYSFMFFKGLNFVTFDKEKKPWNLMLLLHLQLVRHLQLAQVLSHPQLIFPSKTWFFEIYLNFQQQKPFKNQYLPHSESKSHQIKSIKSCSSRSFQQHQRHIPIPPKILAMI